MARIIGIYNNKGGVGKTTIALFLSDFISSILINKKKSRVLMLDFDTQNSCSNALLGLKRVAELKSSDLTLPRAFIRYIKSPSSEDSIDLDKYIGSRLEKKDLKTRKTKLGNIDVIISDADSALEFEEGTSLADSILIAKWMREQLNEKYDFIFVDLPGNLSKRNGFSLVGAFLVDYFIIPTEPNRINTNTIPSTIKMLNNIKEWRGENKYKLLGFVLNKADKRTKQYKLHKDELNQFANISDCKIYSSILPPTPKLSNASDDSIEYFTLSDRYDSYYKHVRNLVLEIIKDLGFTKNKKPNK